MQTVAPGSSQTWVPPALNFNSNLNTSRTPGGRCGPLHSRQLVCDGPEVTWQLASLGAPTCSNLSPLETVPPEALQALETPTSRAWAAACRTVLCRSCCAVLGPSWQEARPVVGAPGEA